MRENFSGSYTVTGLTRSQMLRELDKYANPSDVRGFALMSINLVLYFISIAIVLSNSWLVAKIFVSVFAGFRLSALYTLVHDAAHRALVKTRSLNWILAVVGGTVTLQNYRLYCDNHNIVHHGRTNADDDEFYRPLSKRQYDALTRTGRFIERFCRSPNIVGLWFYFVFRWLPSKLNPKNVRHFKNGREAWIYLFFQATFHGGFIVLVVYEAAKLHVSAIENIVFSWFLPLSIQCFLTSLSSYLLHNHPRLPWFTEVDRSKCPPELRSVHLVLPHWFSRMINHVYSHPVHHAHAGIPCYNLYEAQMYLNRMLGGKAIVEKFGLRNVLHAMHTCKLYDYERHQWLDFDGRPTTAPIPVESFR